MASNTIVIDPTYLIFLMIGLLFVMRIVNSNGGLKIVLWRLFGVRGFIRVERQPDGSPVRGVYRWSKTVQGTVLQWYLARGKGWFVGQPSETVRVFGLPQWVYNYNDARPIPLEHVQTVEREFEVEVKDPTGNITSQKQKRPIVVAGKPIDPLLIHSWATNRSITMFNNFSDPNANKARLGGIKWIIILGVVMIAIDVYYTYLFGINSNCSLHTKICP